MYNFDIIIQFYTDLDWGHATACNIDLTKMKVGVL